MYEKAEPEIARILKLVETCPESLRPKAFEILLQGYVASQVQPPVPPKREERASSKEKQPGVDTTDWAASIPAEVLPRLRAMAKRQNVGADALAALFDFSTDPFSFAPINVQGKTTKERARRVGLLVGARGFLATGKWVADWAEIKAMCTHQNCYDLANFAATMKEAKGSVFKSVTPSTSVELSADGTKQAEDLIASLAGSTNDSEQ